MRIVLITPFTAELGALEQLLSAEGHHVISARSRSEGMVEVATHRPDVIIADAQVPGIDGLALLRELARRGPPPRVILLCPRKNRVLEEHGVMCLTKPIDLAELHRHLAWGPAVANRVA